MSWRTVVITGIAKLDLLLRALQRGRAGVREGVPAVQLCGGQRAIRGNLQAGGPVQPRVRLPEKRGDGTEPVPHGVQRDQEKIPPGV